MDGVKRKSTFKHAQNAQMQIIPVHTFALHTFCSIMILLAVSEGPDQTARMHRLQADLDLCSPHMPNGTFSLGCAVPPVLFTQGKLQPKN